MERFRDRLRLPGDEGEDPLSLPHLGETAVVSVAVYGSDRDPHPKTRDRVPLLKRIVDALVLRPRWPRVDVVLLPGGFFRIGRPLGHLAHDVRCALLRQKRSGQAMHEASRVLDQLWPGITLAVGVDSHALNKRFGGDQLVLAWQRGELVGLARKAFPVASETNGDELVIWIQPDDADHPTRIVPLANGRRAILCACYDGFALRGVQGSPYAALPALRWMLAADGSLVRMRDEDRARHLERWLALLKSQPPDLALLAIHHFAAPGRDCYWQRHGIAGASAALNGIPIIGAAHFQERLPTRARDSPLAAERVPLRHLSERQHRTAHYRQPEDGFHLVDEHGEALALLRLFLLRHDPFQLRNIP